MQFRRRKEDAQKIRDKEWFLEIAETWNEFFEQLSSKKRAVTVDRTLIVEKAVSESETHVAITQPYRRADDLPEETPSGESSQSEQKIELPGSEPSAAAKADQLIEQICSTWKSGLQAKLETANLVASGKKEFGTGWKEFVKHEKLPFDVRTAQMLARIGEHSELVASHNYANLPDTLNVLHTLAGLTPAQFQKFVASGKIHRKLSIKDARALSSERKKSRETAPGQKAMSRLNSLGTLIKALKKSDEQLPSIRAKLLELTDFLASISATGSSLAESHSGT